MTRLLPRTAGIALLLALGWVLQPSAQQPDTVFETTLVGVVVPQDIQAGDPVVGTVTAEPERYQDRPGLQVVTAPVPPTTDSLSGNVIEVASPSNEPSSDGTLSGVIVEVPKKTEKKDGTGTLGKIFLQAARLGADSLPLLFRRPGGERPVSTAHVPVTARTQPPPETYEMPGVVANNDVGRITGPMGRNPELAWGDTPGYVVAGNPREAYFQMPMESVPGGGKVTLTDAPVPTGGAKTPSTTPGTPAQPVPPTGSGGKPGESPLTSKGSAVVFEGVTLVGLDLKASGPTKVVTRGNETPVRASVVGNVPAATLERRIPSKSQLAHVPYRAQAGAPGPGDSGRIGLLIENKSPGTIKLEGEKDGAIMKWFDKGEATRGTMFVDTKIIARRAGAYNVQARVIAVVAPVPGKVTPPRGMPAER